MSNAPRTARCARGALLSPGAGTIDPLPHHSAYRPITIDTAGAHHFVRLDGDRPPVG